MALKSALRLCENYCQNPYDVTVKILFDPVIENRVTRHKLQSDRNQDHTLYSNRDVPNDFATLYTLKSLI